MRIIGCRDLGGMEISEYHGKDWFGWGRCGFPEVHGKSFGNEVAEMMQHTKQYSLSGRCDGAT